MALPNITEAYRVGLVLRKSRGDIDFDLAKHETRLREVAERRGFTIERVFKEVISGGTELADRDDLLELIAYVKSRPYAILATDLDRIARDAIATMTVLKELKRYGVRLIIGDTEHDLSQSGAKTLTQIQAVLGEAELDAHKRRLFAGRMDSAKAGKHASGKAPIGYRYDRNTRQLLKDEETSKIIEKIFADFTAGRSMLDIAQDLNLLGVPVPSSGTDRANRVGWIKQTVKRIIQSPIYCGKISFNKKSSFEAKGWDRPHTDEVVFTDGTHEPYLTYPEWLVLQDRVTKAPRSTNKKTIFPLTGLVRCSKCGCSMGQHQPRPGEIYVKMCYCRGTSGVNAKHLLDALIAESQTFLAEVVSKVQIKDADGSAELLEALTKAIADLKREKDRALLSFQKGWTDEAETEATMKKLTAEIKETQTRLEALQKEANVKLTADERTDRVRESLTALLTPNMDWTKQNQILKSIVKSIRYNRDVQGLDIEIEWR